MKRFSRNNLTLVFFQKEDDQKFSFLIENETELTQKLFSCVKTKRVREDKIKYAVDGIFDKIEEIIKKDFDSYDNYVDKLIQKTEEMENVNPIIELAELVQRQYGKSIETRVTGKTGADHMPNISVEIELPDGRKFTAYGTNKRIAKQKAAQKALANFIE